VSSQWQTDNGQWRLDDDGSGYCLLLLLSATDDDGGVDGRSFAS
jgi:hypothetical protein